MIGQLMFVACLTRKIIYMHVTWGNIWRWSIVCRKNWRGTWKTW